MAWYSDWMNYVSPIAWIPGVKEGVRDFGDQLMGKGEYDPAKKAEPYFDKSREQYQPYAQQGQAAYNTRNPILNEMTQNPAEYLQKMMSGYQQSSGYQTNRDEALRAASATAAAGGRRGTPQDMENQAKIADTLSGNDMQRWLQNVMGIQGQGMTGLQDTYNKGYEASGDIANTYSSQGGMQFQNQSQQNQKLMDMIKSLMELMSKAGGAAAGMK
jgi:hypothetical protein